MRHWKVEIKEVGNPTTVKSELIGDFDENYCVNWWGLKNTDVEWYKLEEVIAYEQGEMAVYDR